MKNQQKPTPPAKGSPEYQKNRVRSARGSLITALALTAVNCLLLLALGAEDTRYFLFSIWFPYTKVLEAMLLGAYLRLVSAGIMTGVFIVCAVFWNKSKAFPVTALVIFVLDCLYMVWWVVNYQAAASMIVDILFHIWALVSLIQGCLGAFALDKQQASAQVFRGPEL